MPKMIGTLNGYVSSAAWFNGKRFCFDGTTKGLVRSAHAAGAKAGSLIEANFGGMVRSGAKKMTVIAAPHDNRAFGLWAV